MSAIRCARASVASAPWSALKVGGAQGDALAKLRTLVVHLDATGPKRPPIDGPVTATIDNTTSCRGYQSV